MIELESVSVQFDSRKDQRPAVSDVNLSIQKGEIFGIIGYSGAGKSTLVRTMNHLQVPSSGKVRINGHSLSDMDEAGLRQQRQKIGMIFQHFNLMDRRTVFDNVALALKNTGKSREEISEKVDYLLEMVGLSHRRYHYPKDLSGGQKQRVAIARALANDPDILLCDEATSALDPKTTQSILKLLRLVNQDLGLTIVLITHEMSVIKDLCDRVAVMDQGCIVEYGDIVDIFSDPKEDLTREFIEHTTQLDHNIQLVLQHSMSEKVMHQDGYLVHIKYRGDITGKPIIADLARHFSVKPSILHGHIEILRGIPVGSLLLAMNGEARQIALALDYLQDHGAHYSVIKGGDRLD